MEVPELVKHHPRPGEKGMREMGIGEKGMTRLFMTLGRKDKVQAAEILKAVAGEAGIPGRSVGKIDIMDHFTFFEVPSEIVEKVLTAMNRAVIKGKKVAVTKAKPLARSSPSHPKKRRK
jgi:ATP-dependent RNA helicase DeaD